MFILYNKSEILNIESEYNIKARKHMAAYKIQKYWLNLYYNPENQVCKKRLKREFENLTRV
jgi:hypothetical protein